ncbi:MAG: hypothetical protein IJ762_06010 [Bacteroidaceae bacterium]|nr:hypothetical protein [Bacteroidaceae bacterium]
MKVTRIVSIMLGCLFLYFAYRMAVNAYEEILNLTTARPSFIGIVKDCIDSLMWVLATLGWISIAYGCFRIDAIETWGNMLRAKIRHNRMKRHNI